MDSLHVKIEKCEFFKEEIEFLGYNIKKGGFAVSESKVNSVQEWPVPKSTKQLRGFLGLANFCRKFIPHFSEKVKCLTEMTSTKKKFIWNDEMQLAFDDLKQCFTKTPVLMKPDFTKTFVLSTDASDHALGGMLSQYDPEGELRPIAFYSHKFSPAERNYDVFDKELLAILFCLKYWRRYLEGTKEPVIIYSDHKNLVSFTTQKKRKQRHYR